MFKEKVYVHMYVRETEIVANNLSFEYLSFRTLQQYMQQQVNEF